MGGLRVGGGDEGVELLRAVFGEDAFGALHKWRLGDMLAEGFGLLVAYGGYV